MPCDSIRRNAVDLSALGRIDLNLLVAAFQALGLGGRLSPDKQRIDLNDGSYSVRSGKLQTYDRDLTIDRVKQAYSAEVVKSTAKRFGWQLKEVSQFKFEVIKR